MAAIPFPNPVEIRQKLPQDAARKATAHPVDSFLGRLGKPPALSESATVWIGTSGIVQLNRMGSNLSLLKS